MTSYSVLKLLHIVGVIISGVLFAVRFGLLNLRQQRPLPRSLKVLPHINDTLLLAAAIGMLALTNVNPMQVSWLSAKLAALLAYIGFGALCLHSNPGSKRQKLMFFLAVSTFSYIVWVALTKSALPIL